MIERPTLVVMLKAPRIGAGKTRLAADIGRVEALRINRALQANTLRVARDPRWRTVLCVAPDHALDSAFPGIWPRRSIERIPQGAGDLGARLARALERHRNIAVIGADCPMLSRVHIASAFAALKNAPFAMGQTDDGGFWVFAARDGRAAACAMSDVRWSSEHAAADVLRNLAPARVARLATLWDVDVAADLARWRAQRSANRPSSGR